MEHILKLQYLLLLQKVIRRLQQLLHKCSNCIYELIYNSKSDLEHELLNYLTNLSNSKSYAQLINNGLNLIAKSN